MYRSVPSRIRWFYLIDNHSLVKMFVECLVTPRDPRSVEEPLQCVFLHGPQHMFPVLLALVLVEQGEDHQGHLDGGIIAGLLRDKDDVHADLVELAFIKWELMRSRKKREKECTTNDPMGGESPPASEINCRKVTAEAII